MNGLVQSSKKRIDLTTSPLAEEFLRLTDEVELAFIKPSNISEYSTKPKKKKKKEVNL